MHALAQLPSELELELGCEERQHGELELLARAYGLDERVAFRGASGSGAVGEIRRRRPDGTTVMVADDDVARASTMAELVESLWPPGDCEAFAGGADQVLNGHGVGIVTNLPARYRIPLFNRLQRRLERAGARFRVFFLGSGAPRRTWLYPTEQLEFEHEFVDGFRLPIRQRAPRVPLGLGRRLQGFQPSILLVGGLSPLVASPAARYARANGAIFGLWSGEISRMATAQSRLRTVQRRRLLQQATFAVAYGSLAARYLRLLAPALPIVIGRNTSVSETQGERTPVVSGPVELLTVGDLGSKRKGIDLLVEALAAIPELPCRLTVVGGGRERSLLEANAGGDQRIRFMGGLPAERVHDLYREAAAFLFPSRADVFGLVLVEAMAAGLATVTSTAPGAVADLALPERNCLVLDTHDPTEWSEAIRQLAGDRHLRSTVGTAARATVARRWTMDHAVEAMTAGLRLAALQAEGGAR